MSTMTTSPLPSRHGVRTRLESLLGRDVEVSDSQPVPSKASNVVAVYVTGKLAVSALAVVNIEGAARLGGARARLTRGVIDDAITSKALSAALRENCYQVLEGLSSVFNTSGAPHVRLYEMLGPQGNLPSDVAALGAAVGNRMDIQLTITGIGTGQLSVICR
jgi:hypothetical protein